MKWLKRELKALEGYYQDDAFMVLLYLSPIVAITSLILILSILKVVGS